MLKLGSGLRITRAARRRQRGEGGATAVEMAMVAPAFFMLMIGLTETGLILTAQQILENAAFNTSRLAKTGYADSGSSQLATVTSVMDKELASFGTFFDVSKVTFSYKTYDDFSTIDKSGYGSTSMGTASQIVVYTISYPWALFTPMMGNAIGTWDASTQHYVINLTTRIVVRNEPYS